MLSYEGGGAVGLILIAAWNCASQKSRSMEGMFACASNMSMAVPLMLLVMYIVSIPWIICSSLVVPTKLLCLVCALF